MTTFLRLLEENDKAHGLRHLSAAFRGGVPDNRIYLANTQFFLNFPGASFAYWTDDEVRYAFSRFNALESDETNLVARRGVNSNDDFRFLRSWIEVKSDTTRWVPHPKGGEYKPFYSDVSLVIDWHLGGEYLKAERITDRVYASAIVPSKELYFRPGLTWSRRTKSRLSMRVMPKECIFADKGPAVIVSGDQPRDLFCYLAIFSSNAFYKLVEVQLAAADARPGGAAHSFEVGVIQRTPIPAIDAERQHQLSVLARQAWSLKRKLDTVTETSHAFLLTTALRERLGDYDPSAIQKDLACIQAKIDDIACELYGFYDDNSLVERQNIDVKRSVGEDDGDEDLAHEVPSLDALVSWAVGVAFGRFDWRLATGEREAPPEPDPFDPLPARSPGMLPDGAEAYHYHAGILVDDPNQKHDLPRLMADVLETVDTQVDEDLRRWLRRDFFKYHLQQYSKSRRKAPIYWPLATASGSYTLWLYYPDLTDQTLFTAVNDFVEPKLKQVDNELANLRLAGASRSRKDENRLEELSDFRDELADLRDTLLRIAPDYKPNHDDGVQITAAPLWPLFRHKPWQKVLKETWEKLEQGDYDWAHLAMAYWPERVLEKCITDKSLAIAHDLEHLYVEPEPAPKKTRGRKKNTGSSE